MRRDSKETKEKRDGDPVSEMSSSLEDAGFERPRWSPSPSSSGIPFPQIVTLYGICLDQSPYCLVMEFMPKGSLYEVLHSPQELPWALRSTISLDIAMGLAHVHEQGILHRDLKSLNILINDRGRAKISDFGLSKIKTQTRTTSNSRRGAGSSPVGSLPWMALEVFKRGGKPTLASDVYSLAMIFWEISARKTPWEEAEDSSLISAWVVEGERETIPGDCPAAFAALIQACWVGKPTQRYSADQAVEELQKMIKASNDEPSVSSSSSSSEVPSSPTPLPRLSITPQGRLFRQQNHPSGAPTSAGPSAASNLNF